MSDDPPSDDRLKDLGKRIAEAQGQQPGHKPPPPASGLGAALRMSTELVAAVVVGLVLGFGIDWLFGTRPFGLLVGLGLGIAAGFFNVFRLAAQMSKKGRG
ncbi:MAG TPA: hypothetical protein DCL54_15985 [Alphaproteobacteria bacterium]|nr:hypothetical protein [Alphaproteobacteria bacterium]HAJ48073.1 hypothetical protein [Alphaproteobacteria bacterium]